MLFLALLAASPADCVRVSGEHLLAGDLAGRVPAFAGLPAGTRLGFSPAPGVRRIIRAPELARAARAQGLELERAHEVCLERAARPATVAEVIAALRRHPELGKASIEIVEVSPDPLPEGELVFPLESLGCGPEVRWLGHRRTPMGKKYSLWIRARIEAREMRLFSSRPLSPGSVLTPADLEIREYAGPYCRSRGLQTLEQAVGSRVLRPVPSGAEILPSVLEAPADVGRGDLVEVVVGFGAARIRVAARAESSGRVGQIVRLKNLDSGRTFTGKVTGRRAAVAGALSNRSVI